MAWDDFNAVGGGSWVPGGKFGAESVERARLNFVLLKRFSYTGAGSPESVITASIGAVYTRTDGSTGTTLYIKQSGTGNTGWVAVGDRPTYAAGNSGTALTIDWANGPVQLVTLTGACTFTFTNPLDGLRATLLLKQDATGTRVPTLPSTVKYPGGTTPTWSTVAGHVDLVTFTYVTALGASGNYLAVADVNFTPA